MAWGLHDGIEAEKRGKPAVTVITQAFTKAAELRARALGLPQHPVVVVEHPIASKSASQVKELANASLEQVVRALVSPTETQGHD